MQSLVEEGHLVGERGAHRLIEPPQVLRVPGTVQSLVASRIDRQSDRDKQLLHLAAVIGKRFSHELLESVSELSRPELSAALMQLIDAGFIFERALYPDREYDTPPSR